MAEKKRKPNDKPKIEVQTRKPESRGIFANLGKDRSTNTHPLREIMNFPSDNKDAQDNSTNSPLVNQDISNPEHPVNQKEPALVNQSASTELTKKLNLVNQNELTKNDELVNQEPEAKLTKPDVLVNLLTEEPKLLTKTNKKEDKIVNNLTKPSDLVNQNSTNIDWKAYERSRSKSREVVEGFRTSKDLKQRVKTFCAKEGIDKQDFYNMAIPFYLDHLVNQTNNPLVNKLTSDDRRKMKMWKTKPHIINIYLAYNAENKWKFSDDEAALIYNDTDFRLIELGIIETQFNSGFKKINSFSYYQNEIDQFISQELAEETLKFLHSHYRDKWKKKTDREIEYSFLEE